MAIAMDANILSVNVYGSLNHCHISVRRLINIIVNIYDLLRTIHPNKCIYGILKGIEGRYIRNLIHWNENMFLQSDYLDYP